MASRYIVLPSGGSGVASNSFETINCPSGTDPVADSSTDTLNLTSTGGTITITGNSTTDTVNFDLNSSATPTFSGLTVSSLTPFNFVYADGSSALASASWQYSSGNIVSTSPGQTISVSGTGLSSQQFGESTSAGGDYSLAVGYAAQAGAASALAAGYGSTANGGFSTAIGTSSSTSTSTSSTAIGSNASATYDQSISIGYSSYSNGTNSTAIGTSTSAGSYTVAIGSGISSMYSYQVLLGSSISPNPADYGILIGDSLSSSSYTYPLLVGFSSTVSGAYSIAIGYGQNDNSSSRAVVIGSSSNAYGDDAIVIGTYSSAYAGGITLGYSSASSYSGVAIGYSATSGQYTVSVGQTISGGGVNNGVLLGSSASGTSDNIVSIGYYASAGQQYSIVIGSGSVSSGTGGNIVIGASASDQASADSVVIGYGSLSYGTGGTALGFSAFAGENSVVAGKNASAQNSGNVCIGYQSVIDTSSGYSQTIGYGALVNGSYYSTAIGTNAQSNGYYQVVIGYQASGGTSKFGAVAIGNQTVAGDDYAIAIGSNATTNFSHSIAIGYISNAGSNDSVAVGYSASISSSSHNSTAVGSGISIGTGYQRCTAVGSNINISGEYNFIGGYGHSSSGADNIIIGSSNTSGYADCIVIGRGVQSTAAGQCVIGNTTQAISAYYFGNGVTHGTPSSITFQPTAATGTNINGANFSIRGGNLTGTGAGGSILLYTAPPGSSGTTAGTFVERVNIKSSSEMAFNDGAADYDFRVEAVSDSNMFFIDASANAIGIGTNSPGARLDLRGRVAADVISKITGVASQSGRYLSVVNSSSQDLLYFAPTGSVATLTINEPNNANTLLFSVRKSSDGGLNVYPLLTTMNYVIGHTLQTNYIKRDQNATATIPLYIGSGRKIDGTSAVDGYTSTSGNISHVAHIPSFTPGSGTANFAAYEMRPTINGTSSGVATALAISVVTATLTGGTVNLIDAGTTSTDYYTGHTSVMKLSAAGELAMQVAGKGVSIKEGTNARMGKSTLVAGTVTVNTTAVTANSRVFLTHQNNSGTPGFVTVSARTAGTSFTITSSNAADTSDIAWIIFEPS